MATISCVVDYTDLEGDHGDVPGVVVTCSKCDHSTESFGQGDKSVKRCFALLREECPEGEENYYKDEDE